LETIGSLPETTLFYSLLFKCLTDPQCPFSPLLSLHVLRNFCPACLATTRESCIQKTCLVLISSLVPSIGLLWSSSTRPICSVDNIQTLQQNRASALQDATLTPAKPLGDV
jgi:hypothetical protein